MEEKKRKSEEYKRLVAKGQRWFTECLVEVWKETEVSEETARAFFDVIREEYRRRMWEDEKFYSAVKALCSERRFKREKLAFFNGVLKLFMRTPSFNRKCLERIEGYTTLPKEYEEYA